MDVLMLTVKDRGVKSKINEMVQPHHHVAVQKKASVAGGPPAEERSRSPT